MTNLESTLCALYSQQYIECAKRLSGNNKIPIQKFH